MDSDDLWTSRMRLPTLLASAEESTRCMIGAHAIGDFIDKDGSPVNEGAFAEFGMRRFGFDGERIRLWPLPESTSFATVTWMTPLYPPGLIIARREVYEKRAPLIQRRNPGRIGIC